MRGTWWKIARLELTLAARDRESLIWSLVAPIAMAWIFGAMFGGDGKPEPTHVRVAEHTLAPVAERYLEWRGFEIADDGVVVALPDSMLQKLADGRAVDIRVMQGDVDANRAQAVSAAMRQFAYELAFKAPELQVSGLTDSPSPSASPLATEPSTLELQTRPLGAAPKIASGKERMLPAMLIMYIMFQVMTFFLSLWVDDLRSGKIKRIVMSPATPRDLLLGEIAARLIWAGVQVAVILGVGSLLLGVRLDVNWLNFGLVVLAFMLAAAAIGMMAASFFRSSEKAGAIGVMISLVLAALGGCWWPLEIVPGAMRAVALALPTGQAMSAIGEMLAIGPASPFPLAAISVLLTMALIAMLVTARRMRPQLVQ